ncbi:HAD family hydrolase [Bifidobacterium cuniculi]|uniref:HAD-superfamily hydrolase n=1 Tax=Bifidobacterium cuniculi TaxID=1688 RepID=A0A087AZK6_9BIFI|nr:HAD family phosphatase [Bifidobacterium cuniculi]KFI64206.1 HAD-superfamily hydrolase [Bifidobacterium cuniculi]
MTHNIAANWPGDPQMPADTVVAGGNAAGTAHNPLTDVIFDFGNVLIQWDAESVMVPRYGAELTREFFTPGTSGYFEASNMLDAGEPAEQAYAFVKDRYGERWASMMRYYHENFVDSLHGLVPGARVLVDDLRRANIGVWGLSNWDPETFPLAQRQVTLFEQLDGMVVSGYVGLIKPHADIFEHALRQFGIDRATSVFVDDRSGNIQGANAVGLRGIMFRDPRALRAALIALGADIPPVEES